MIRDIEKNDIFNICTFKSTYLFVSKIEKQFFTLLFNRKYNEIYNYVKEK